MRSIFTSPFFFDTIKNTDKQHRGTLIKYLENSQATISYHLEKLIPKGGIICAYHPKSILAHILPGIAKEKKCKVIAVHGTKESIFEFLKAGMIINEQPNNADVFLAEPDGLVADGALFTPYELQDLPHDQIIAVSSIFQFTIERPASYDVARVSKVVTEVGTYSPEHLALEIPIAFSQLSSSLPSLRA